MINVCLQRKSVLFCYFFKCNYLGQIRTTTTMRILQVIDSIFFSKNNISFPCHFDSIILTYVSIRTMIKSDYFFFLTFFLYQNLFSFYCVTLFLRFFFLMTKIGKTDSITNVKQKINEISVSCRFLSLDRALINKLVVR